MVSWFEARNARISTIAAYEKGKATNAPAPMTEMAKKILIQADGGSGSLTLPRN